MRKTTTKAISLTLATMMLLLTVAPIITAVNTTFTSTPTQSVQRNQDPPSGLVWLADWQNRSFLPMLVLYDPYGEGSYQQVTTTSTVSRAFHFFSKTPGYYSEGTMGTSCTLLETYSSSTSSSPNDMGPGIGDTIIAKAYDITWEVWGNPDGSGPYELRYKSSQEVQGTFVCSRSDIDALSDGRTHIEDKTGQGGNVNWYWWISANRTVEKQLTYTMRGSISTGYWLSLSVGLSILGISISFNIQVGFDWTFAGEQSFSIKAHYFDSHNALHFYESTNAGSNYPDGSPYEGLETVNDYVFWYSPSDNTPPNMSSPPDISNCVQGSIGNSITWNVGDQHPHSQKIERTFQGQTTTISSVFWYVNGSIKYDIPPGDILQVGIYTFTCTVYDYEMNHASDSVNVTVISDITPPTINSPPDIIVYTGTSNNIITWHATDDEPISYQITIDSVAQPSQTWNGGDITWNIDGLAPGTYAYKCTVTDAGNNIKSDEVIVTVVPDVAPSIDHPSDVLYQVGTTGHSITWHPRDSDPSTYQITRGGVVVQSGSWSGGDISVSVDGLAIGNYLYTCSVVDARGHIVSDDVTVAVRLEVVAPTIDSPPDVTYWWPTEHYYVTWHASDANPGTYQITRNGQVIQSGPWTSGGSITVDVGGLGYQSRNGRVVTLTYTFVCTVWDSCGNSNSDTVYVYVKCPPWN